MEREVGGRIGMGNTCKPMAVSFKCMTSTTNKKKINVNHRTFIKHLSFVSSRCSDTVPVSLAPSVEWSLQASPLTLQRQGILGAQRSNLVFEQA